MTDVRSLIRKEMVQLDPDILSVGSRKSPSGQGTIVPFGCARGQEQLRSRLQGEGLHVPTDSTATGNCVGVGCRTRPQTDVAKPTARAELSEGRAVALARRYAKESEACVDILKEYSAKHVLDPTKQQNRVQVSSDHREVTFVHNGFAYDGDMVKVVVAMDADGNLLRAKAVVWPGGYQ